MTVYMFNRDDKSEPIIYAECKECKGSEQIQDIKDARHWFCTECTKKNWDIIIERERDEIYKHV